MTMSVKLFDSLTIKDFENESILDEIRSSLKKLEKDSTKPPIGLTPKEFHKKRRFYNVCSAITRYYSAGLKIPIEWIEEYNELLDKT